MGKISDITVPARREGVSSAACGKKIREEISDLSFNEVVEAFAFAGYPPDDSIKGILSTYDVAGKITAAVGHYYGETEVKRAAQSIFPADLL